MHSDGRKLGKRHRSDPLASVPPAQAVYLALKFLGQSPPAGMGLEDLWCWAIENWHLASVPRSTMNPGSGFAVTL
jgi:glutamyl-Q tRNA(Asp) synthetase